MKISLILESVSLQLPESDFVSV